MTPNNSTTTQANGTSKSAELKQPWKAVWPQTKKLADKSVTYEYKKGTKMSVEGSAGEAYLDILYDTDATLDKTN